VTQGSALERRFSQIWTERFEFHRKPLEADHLAQILPIVYTTRLAWKNWGHL